MSHDLTPPAPMAFQHLAAELRVFAGGDALAALGKELRRAGCSRAVAIRGRSVGDSVAMQALRQALGPTLVAESVTVRPNSPVSAVEQAARDLRQAGADAVIAIGGGSAAVTARAAAILLAEDSPAGELCTRRGADGRFESPRLDAPKLPQFVLPTTPSTAFVKAGSAVHDDATGERLALFDPKTRARALFLHPGLLATAPAELVRSAALNTLSTAVEALESPRCDPLSEAQLLQALRLLARRLDQVGPQDAQARQDLALAGILCGRGTEAAGGGLSSVLAHAIGHRVHASNGLVNAVVLPHTMRFNAPATVHAAERISAGLAGAGATAATDPADLLQQLLQRLPIPHRLRELGLPQQDLDAVAQAAMGDWFISRCARPVTQVAQVRAILDAAW